MGTPDPRRRSTCEIHNGSRCQRDATDAMVIMSAGVLGVPGNYHLCDKQAWRIEEGTRKCPKQQPSTATILCRGDARHTCKPDKYERDMFLQIRPERAHEDMGKRLDVEERRVECGEYT